MAIFDRTDRSSPKQPETPAPQPAPATADPASPPRSDPKAPRYPASGAPRANESALIGPGLKVEGEVRGAEDLILDGEVKGALALGQHQLLIGEAGRAEADVTARRVIIYGVLVGNVEAAEAIELGHTARVQGNLRTPALRIDEGALLNGRVEMGATKTRETRAAAQASSASGKANGAAAPKEAASPPAQPA